MAPNVPTFFAIPLAAKMCTYVDMRDNMTIDEIADMNEVMAVKAENEARAMKAAEADAKRKGI